MKIESATITMASAHVAHERTTVAASVQTWSQRTVTAEPAAAAIRQADIDDPAEDPRLALLLAMIEHITGHKVRTFRMSELVDPNTYTPPPQPSAGMSVQVRGEHSESEHVAFAASGVVRTADGQEIRFDLGFTMERHFAERISLDVQTGAPRQLQDPLVLDFAGPGARLSDARFAFDLDADGTVDEIPLPVSGRGFLAIDRNANGRIDDGRELFGPMTGNGFTELAALDTDGNGWIDSADAAFSQLRLWQPDAHGEGRLMTLAEAGVGALYLGNVATPFSLRDPGNMMLGQMRSSSVYIGTDGQVGTVSQIDLAV